MPGFSGVGDWLRRSPPSANPISADAVRDPIRKIFRRYFNPHSFNKTLAQLGQRLCQTAEQFTAWSQNLGHDHPLTNFSSYGNLELHRQGEIMGSFGAEAVPLAEDVAQMLRRACLRLERA